MNLFFSADWFYPSQMGGPSNAIYWQAKALTRVGKHVTVVATSQNLPTEIPLNRWLEMDCGRVIYTKNPHFYLPLRHILYAIAAIWRANVVHINSLFYPSSVVLIIAAQLFRKPIIWSPHGELSSKALIYRPWLKRTLLHLFRAVSRGVIFHATAPSEAADIRQHFGNQAITQEIGLMMEMPPTAQRNDRKYLLFMGRLHPIKGIDRLLEALSQSTLFINSDYTLVVAGPGSDAYAQQLKRQTYEWNLSPKVSFIGPVRGQEKEQLYADAHLTILPSHSENFGNVVVESLAQGTPVVASTGTPWQLLADEQIGDWVENSPQLLRQAIEHYLLMPADTYHQQRKRAYVIARQKFDIMANVAKWQQLYETVAA